MMIDGTYALDIDSHLGPKKGKAVISTQGDTAIVDVDVPIIGKQRGKGIADGNAFAVKGSIKVLFMGKINYTISGCVEGDKLVASIETNRGNLELVGKRM